MEQQPTSAPADVSPGLLMMAGVLAIAIFVIDAVTPLDIAVAVLYVVVVLLAADVFGLRGILLVSAGCLALTVLAYLLSHGLTATSALGRCLMSISAIAITTLLAWRNQSAKTVLREQASLLDLTHDTIFVRAMDDVITYWNRGAEQLYGWPREQAVGKPCHQLMRTSFPAPLEGIMAELVRTDRWEGEVTHAKRDGQQVVVASRWSLQRDERGRPVGIMETNNNVTERKRADAEQRAKSLTPWAFRSSMAVLTRAGVRRRAGRARRRADLLRVGDGSTDPAGATPWRFCSRSPSHPTRRRWTACWSASWTSPSATGRRMRSTRRRTSWPTSRP